MFENPVLTQNRDGQKTGSAMIGVVVWADTAKLKAVIWCEDQRDLAYFIQREEHAQTVALNKGDLVKFESRYESGLRMAGRVQVVEPCAEPHLSDALLDQPAPTGETVTESEICENAHQGAEVACLSIPDRIKSRSDGHRPSAERKSAKILAFPERLRA